MNTSDLYDLTVVIIVIIFAIRGYQKGLIHQIGTLISMIAGVVVSIRFTPMLAAQLPGNDKVRFIGAFVLLLLAATLVVWGIINTISQVITNLKLNSWNNQMGALLGMFYGILCSMALTFVLLVYAVPVSEENQSSQSYEQPFITQSKIGPYLTIVTLKIIDYLPQSEEYVIYNDLREYLRQSANNIKESNPNLPKDALDLSAPNAQDDDDDKPRLPSPLSPEP